MASEFLHMTIPSDFVSSREACWTIEQLEEALTAERSWIKKAFAQNPMGAYGEEERHPYIARWRKNRPVSRRAQGYYEPIGGPVMCRWGEEQIPQKKQEQNELQVGDTAELDSFLSGFSKK